MSFLKCTYFDCIVWDVLSDIYTSRNPYHKQDIWHFYRSKRFPCAPFQSVSPFPTPGMHRTFCDCKLDLPFLEFHIIEWYTIDPWTTQVWSLFKHRFLSIVQYCTILGWLNAQIWNFRYGRLTVGLEHPRILVFCSHSWNLFPRYWGMTMLWPFLFLASCTQHAFEIH